MVYQTKCTYACRTGYEREGNEHITCQLDETWAPKPHPTCKRKRFRLKKEMADVSQGKIPRQILENSVTKLLAI